MLSPPLLVVAALASPAPQEPLDAYEPLVLPHVLTGEPDAPRRHVVNVLIDGRVVFLGEPIPDGEALADALGEEAEGGALLLRCDMNSPFGAAAELLAECARRNVESVDFAVADARSPALDEDGNLVPQERPQQRIAVELHGEPHGGGAKPEGDEPAPVELALRVLEPGPKLSLRRDEDVPWDGAPGTRFRYDLSKRRVEYAVGPMKSVGHDAFRRSLQGVAGTLRGRTVVVRADAGVTAGEVLFAIDGLRSLEVGGVRLAVGPR